METSFRCTVCHGLLVEDWTRPEAQRVFCAECLRPFCDLCQENHVGANDDAQHIASGAVLSHDVTCGRCERVIHQGEPVTNDDIYGPVHSAGCTEA